MKQLAIVLSFAVGFLSLSQEIVWIRIVSFGEQGRPHAFSLVLAAFLIGIAIGSIVGRRVCEQSHEILRTSGWILLLAAASDLVSIYVCATAVYGPTAGSPRVLLVILGLVGVGSMLKGILFPIVHHLGTTTDQQRIGRSVSRVYLANIIGSTLGPIVTGFWLLDVFSIEVVFAFIALLTALLGLIALARSGLRVGARWSAPVSIAGLGIVSILWPPAIARHIAVGDEDAIVNMVQNKHGIIHVLADRRPGLGDVTYGGNAYDGRINVSMEVNANMLDRAYVMATIHPRPKRALIVGLSTGAWAAIILGIPGIEKLDIVEINPGYLQVVESYPQVARLLTDPRVTIHVDDGRRWLRSNPEARFDLVFQNTTWHWRAYSTLLLSHEYFSEIKRHLHTGGIAAINTTDSFDVYKTALSVFSYVARYDSFAYMSDRPLVLRPDAIEVLHQSTVWGRPAFDARSARLQERLASEPLESAESFLKRFADKGSTRAASAALISDLNMIPEYRHGDGPPFNWLRHFLPQETLLPND